MQWTPAQWNDLAQGAARRFEDDAVAHLARFSPRHCAIVGEPHVREAVQRGMAACTGVGFTHRGPVQLYLELMLLFGSAFATDPQLAWAAQALGAPDPGTQGQRAWALHAAATSWLAAASGDGHVLALAALERLRGRRTKTLSFGPDRWRDGLLADMAAIYPEKFRVVGVDALDRLLEAAHAAAKAAGVWTFEGVVLVAVLMFALGHGVLDDPLHPWVREALADDRFADPPRAPASSRAARGPGWTGRSCPPSCTEPAMCLAGCSSGPSPPASAVPVAAAVVACTASSSELLLLDEIGLPLGGQAVTVRLSGGVVLNTTTGADGRICLNVPAGTAAEVELAAVHEAGAGDATSTPSGHHFSLGGTGP
jgi:hypothetical protein